MERFKVVAGEHVSDGKPKYAVVDASGRTCPSRFSSREDAEAHVNKLESGPFSWDEQEAWQDEWDDDDRSST